MGGQPPRSNGKSGVIGLHGIRGRRVSAGFDGTESAAAGAGVPEKHDGGGGDAVPASIPALADVGALGLLAHGVELQTGQRFLHLLEPLALRGSLPQPQGLPYVGVSPNCRPTPTCLLARRRIPQ